MKYTGQFSKHMATRSSIVSALQNLKMADEYMNDFIRQSPGTRGAEIFRGYSKRINWILNDVITYPHFNDEVREGIKRELSGDVFSVPAIMEKIPLLNPDQRNLMEEIIDDLLKGKTIEINIKG